MRNSTMLYIVIHKIFCATFPLIYDAPPAVTYVEDVEHRDTGDPLQCQASIDKRKNSTMVL